MKNTFENFRLAPGLIIARETWTIHNDAHTLMPASFPTREEALAEVTRLRASFVTGNFTTQHHLRLEYSDAPEAV